VLAPGLVRPESLSELVAGDDLTRSFEQQRQCMERLAGQLDPDSVFAQFPGVQVCFKNTEARRARSSFDRLTELTHCASRFYTRGTESERQTTSLEISLWVNYLAEDLLWIEKKSGLARVFR
jgi:hypothetical protein